MRGSRDPTRALPDDWKRFRFRSNRRGNAGLSAFSMISRLVARRARRYEPQT